MKAMLNDGWFTKSEGDVESPLGFFGYVTNLKAELNEVYDAFSNVVKAYGYPAEKDMVGSFFAMINSDGLIRIVRKDSDYEAKESFFNHRMEYIEWLGDDDE